MRPLSSNARLKERGLFYVFLQYLGSLLWKEHHSHANTINVESKSHRFSFDQPCWLLMLPCASARSGVPSPRSWGGWCRRSTDSRPQSVPSRRTTIRDVKVDGVRMHWARGYSVAMRTLLGKQKTKRKTHVLVFSTGHKSKSDGPHRGPSFFVQRLRGRPGLRPTPDAQTNSPRAFSCGTTVAAGACPTPVEAVDTGPCFTGNRTDKRGKKHELILLP